MKKFFKNAMALALALAMVVTSISVMGNSTVKAAEDGIMLISEAPVEPALTIIYTNDVHTYIDKSLNYGTVASIKKYYESQGQPVLLVDAGDHIQGTAYGGLDEGANIIKLMESAGYDLATLGNHEFDYGMARALEVAKNSKFPYISCNFKDLQTGKSVLDSYKIFTYGDKKVAFVGITTPETFTKSTPKYFMNDAGEYIYGIDGGKKGKLLYKAVQKAIDAAKADGADYVIALGHLGVDKSSKPWRSTDVIKNTTGLTAFIDGHSHSTVASRKVTDKSGNTVILSQTGSYFSAIGIMTLTAEGNVSTRLATKYHGEGDEATLAIQNEWMKSVDDLLGVVIAKTEVPMYISDPDTNKRLIRSMETALGDYCADALYYLFDVTEGLDVDVAIMNGGGVRSNVPAGDITYKTCKTVHTFGNVACLMTITGQQLLNALEWGAKDVGVGENGGFLQVSGIKFTIDSSVAANVQKDEKNVWVGAPNDEYRVKNVEIYNKETGKYEALDLNAEYNIAGYNYTLRNLGDGFAMFSGAKLVKDYVMLDYLCLANYAKSFPKDENGIPTIGKDSIYANKFGEGRVTIE